MVENILPSPTLSLTHCVTSTTWWSDW